MSEWKKDLEMRNYPRFNLRGFAEALLIFVKLVKLLFERNLWLLPNKPKFGTLFRGDGTYAGSSSADFVSYKQQNRLQTMLKTFYNSSFLPKTYLICFNSQKSSDKKLLCFVFVFF